MLNPKAMDGFLDRHGIRLTKVNEVRDKLAARFHQGELAIDAVLLGALCGYPCLLFGPPGVAKSKLIRDFCVLTGVTALEETQGKSEEVRADNRTYFEYLLTKFTEPTELFGSFQVRLDPAKNVQELVRVEQGMLHKCQVAFLDEVFNGSSAILNSLLALLNEGVFHDRGEIKKSNLKMLFGATNYPPQAQGLDAIFDRFVIRGHMVNAERTSLGLSSYLKMATGAQRALSLDECYPGLFDDIRALTEDFEATEASPDKATSLFDWTTEDAAFFVENLSYTAEVAEFKGLGSFSNRRVYQLARAMCMARLLRASRDPSSGGWELSFDEYAIMWRHFLDTPRPVDGEDLEAFESLPSMPRASGTDE